MLTTFRALKTFAIKSASLNQKKAAIDTYLKKKVQLQYFNQMRQEFRHRRIIKGSQFSHDSELKKKVFTYFKMSYK